MATGGAFPLTLATNGDVALGRSDVALGLRIHKEGSQLPIVNNPFRVWALGTDGKREGIVESRLDVGYLSFTARIRGPHGACLAYEVVGE